MRNDYKAIRIEIPTELYNKFKKYTKEEYKTQTGVTREMIVKYVKERENDEK